MNPELIYLAEEVCNGLEIYFTSWKGGQYRRTAFLLCDDYVELSAKLFLGRTVTDWTDKKSNSHFKNFHLVLDEVVAEFAGAEATEMAGIVSNMKARRSRRNDFFHSASLLDLSLGPRACVEAFLQLGRFNELCYGDEWTDLVPSVRSLQLMQLLVEAEFASFSDPTIQARVDSVLSSLPRNMAKPKKLGTHVAQHPEDLHLRLCLAWNSGEFQDRLAALLEEAPPSS